MSHFPTPQPAYKMTLTPTQRLELDDWLDVRPATRIVGQPSSAMSCLLGTYLLAETKHLWCVSQQHFWRFDLVPELAWQLPAWAASLERAELRLGTALTAAQGLKLVRRHVPRTACALADADEEDGA